MSWVNLALPFSLSWPQFPYQLIGKSSSCLSSIWLLERLWWSLHTTPPTPWKAGSSKWSRKRPRCPLVAWGIGHRPPEPAPFPLVFLGHFPWTRCFTHKGLWAILFCVVCKVPSLVGLKKSHLTSVWFQLEEIWLWIRWEIKQTFEMRLGLEVKRQRSHIPPQHMAPFLPPSSLPRYGLGTRHSQLHAWHILCGQRQREQPPFIKVSTCTKKCSTDLCNSHERSILQMRKLKFRDWLAPTALKYWARSRTQLYCLSTLLTIMTHCFLGWVQGEGRSVFRSRPGQVKGVFSVYSGGWRPSFCFQN